MQNPLLSYLQRVTTLNRINELICFKCGMITESHGVFETTKPAASRHSTIPLAGKRIIVSFYPRFLPKSGVTWSENTAQSMS